jgi:tetratricopeptide (TPR) repeat protein
MTNEFEEIMAGHSDLQLYDIIKNHRDDYQPLAITAAEEEFKKRGLTFDQIELILSGIEEKEKIAADCNLGVHNWVDDKCSYCGIIRADAEYTSLRDDTYYVTERDANEEIPETEETETKSDSDETEDTARAESPDDLSEIKDAGNISDPDDTVDIFKLKNTDYSIEAEDTEEPADSEEKEETFKADEEKELLQSMDEIDYGARRLVRLSRKILIVLLIVVAIAMGVSQLIKTDPELRIPVIAVVCIILFFVISAVVRYRKKSVSADQATAPDQNTSDSIEKYKTMLKQNPDDFETWYNLGLAYEEINNNSKAMESYQKAVALKSDYGLAWGALGYICFVNGDIQRSKEALNKAIACGEKDNAVMNLGHTLLIEYNEPKAIENYKAAIKNFSDTEEFFIGFDNDYKYLERYGISKDRYANIRNQLTDFITV